MSKNKLMESQIGQGMVFFLVQEKHWNSLQSFCVDYYKRTNDPFYIFWKAFSQYSNGNLNGAINSLLSICEKKQIAYASIVALLFYQNKAKNIDRDQIDSLRSKEREERRNGSDKAIIQAINFFNFCGEFKKAFDLLQEKNNGSVLYKTTNIWYELLNEQEKSKDSLEKSIDQLYVEKDKNVPKILIFLAKAHMKNLLKKFQEALEVLNEGIIFYPNFLPFITKKFVCLMSLGQWDELLQAALEVSQRDSSNIEANKALAFIELARQGNIQNSLMKIGDLQSVIEKKQSKNAKLLYDLAHLFLRICGRNIKIIEKLQKIIEKCRKYDPLSADYAIEQGNQLLILGKVQQAYQIFQQASTLDESKLDSITGMIQCKLLQEQIDDAQNQIQFVNVMQQTVGRTPTIAYLQAMLTIRKPNQTNQSRIQFYKILDGALKMQIAYSKTLVSGFSYYSKLDPNFLFSISELYLQPVSIKQMIEGNQNPNSSGPIGKGIKLLESITRQIPGFLPAYLLLSKGKLAVGNELDASIAINRVLAIDSRNEEGSIISAMIKNKKKDYESALSSLQDAIAINFKIRQNPLFMMLKGQIQYEMQDYITAQETLVQTIQLPSVKKKVAADHSKKFKILNFTEKDRCSIHLLLAKCYAKNKKSKQSKGVMTQAISQFSNTSQQMHVSLTNAQIAIENGDIKKAMSILKQVKPQSTYFAQSRKLLADIHLNSLKSRKGYARCYFQIIDNNPTFQNYKIYGDALIKIYEPEQASIAYQKAYQQKSDNEQIICDLARCYALAHNYDKAIKFYQSNIEKLNRADLILDLAKLYIQLKKFDKALQLLSFPEFKQEHSTYGKLKQNVQANYLLFKMQLKKQGSYNCNPNQNARKNIKTATQFQKLVIEKLRNQGGSVDQQRLFHSDLYYQIGKYTYQYEKNAQTTVLMLKQCLKLQEQHEKALQMLADINLRQGNLEKSEEMCKILLKINPHNDQAGSILAQILLKSNQYDRAIEQFKTMLDQSPDNYPVLAKLIDFFRRNNELAEAKNYIQNAQNKASNANDAGLCYCRGLYHKYSRNPSQSLIQFNKGIVLLLFKAKKSSQYAEVSLTHMIDIFLCPDQDLYYSAIESKTRTVHPQNIRICESLLRQMQNRASQNRFIVMEALVLIMKGSYKNIQEIIKRLIEVLTVRQEYPPALLVMAIAKYIAKKDVEGNNFLKVCSKMPYQPQFGTQLEKAWLLHAESYIQIKKFDNAEDILRMLLKENKSCGKAEQLMGLIRQKEQAYADACEFYEKAFELTSRKSAAMGYRLAYNFLKSKRYVDCLEVCRQVIQVHPNYTNIRVDIQQKAIQAIR